MSRRPRWARSPRLVSVGAYTCPFATSSGVCLRHDHPPNHAGWTGTGGWTATTVDIVYLPERCRAPDKPPPATSVGRRLLARASPTTWLLRLPGEQRSDGEQPRPRVGSGHHRAVPRTSLRVG